MTRGYTETMASTLSLVKVLPVNIKAALEQIQAALLLNCVLFRPLSLYDQNVCNDKNMKIGSVIQFIQE